MKNRNKAANIVTKIIAAFLAATIMFTAIEPVDVEAKTKTITLKSHDRVSYASEAKSISKKINKKGTYNIKIKNDYDQFHGYVRFVAPKKGTYKFEISKVKDAKKKNLFGFVEGSTPNEYESLIDVDFSTKGGKNAFLNVSNKDYGEYLKKRTGTIKLKKGQVLYLYFSFQRSFSSKAKSMTLQLKVK